MKPGYQFSHTVVAVDNLATWQLMDARTGVTQQGDLPVHKCTQITPVKDNGFYSEQIY
jgi:hypothetical protein